MAFSSRGDIRYQRVSWQRGALVLTLKPFPAITYWTQADEETGARIVHYKRRSMASLHLVDLS
jgi:hypothetical protein